MKIILVIAVLALIAVSISSQGLSSAIAELGAFILVVVSAFKYQKRRRADKKEAQIEPHV
ncbi:hypothetical protein HC723_03420 [Vibrio sp. S11_S32]|uniref:O-succinylbenzoic acid--CoA ligase n=2 Tax=Vibrionaceae TaxID=641 RepID=A0A5Q0TJ73_9VIBR|nr:hypothetical protein [Vibrio sp. S11_S32]